MTKTPVIIAAAALLIGYAVGRYASPEKTIVKTVEVEKKTENVKTDIDKDKHKETTVTETTKPDGTTEKVTKIVETTKTEKKTDKASTVDSSTKNEQETTYASSKLNLGALVGISDFTNSYSGLVYGAILHRRVVGPVTMGVWGLSSGSAGFTVGLEF